MTAMNPMGFSTEVVITPVNHQGLPGQPGGAMVIHSDMKIIPGPPKDHIIWSLCCFVYSNPCCLGLVALIFSIKARDRMMAGDMDGARRYGSSARCLNTAATIVGSIMLFISVVLITVNVTGK